MTFKKIALLFPGQGAQYTGMGKALYETYPLVKEIFQQADDCLSLPLSKIMLEGPEEELTKTAISQPAIYLLSLAVLKLLQKQFPDLKPDFAAGLSLGEYSALSAAGYLDPWDGLKLVAARGRFMSEACDKNPGTMAAVMGLSQQEIESLVREANLPQDLWAANFNAPGQAVLSGSFKGIEQGSILAKERGAKKVVPLKVHGAFHSGLMKSAESPLKERVEETPFYQGHYPVIMNASSEIAKDELELKLLLIKQITLPVRWQESIERLDNNGVDFYLELGCGKTLSALNKRIGVKGSSISIETPEALEQAIDQMEKELA